MTRPVETTDLEFKFFSGANVLIHRDACLDCKTQACVKRCVSSTMEPVLKIQDGIPVLSRSDIKPESGWCVECLACELDCGLYGKKAISIIYADL